METIGIVKDIKSKGLDSPTIVTVEYKIDGKVYTIHESLKLQNKILKFGFIPIGQKAYPKIKCEIGKKISIIYSENNPNKGHIKNNDGIINC